MPTTTRRSDPRARLLTLARYRAKQRRIRFDLSVEDLDMPTYCPVLGLRLKRGKGAPCDESPTLDRIDPRRGYVRGNVIVVSMKANRLKNNATVRELIRVAGYYQQLTE